VENIDLSLRSVIDVLPIGAHFWSLNPENELIFEGANVVADKILGIDHSKLVGQTIEDAFPANKSTDIPVVYRRIAREGGRFEREMVDYNDGVVTGCFEIWAVQIRLNLMVVFFRDVTERKKAEIALANEKERLLVTLQSIGDGVIVTDSSGQITLMNTVAENLTGWTKEEATGCLLPEVFHIVNESTMEQCENPVEKVFRTGQVIGLANHTALISRNGSVRSIADSGAPIRDGTGKIMGVVLVFRDITNQSRMEERINNSQRLESLGVLAGGIAHDFNNLLSGLFGFISLAKGLIDKEEPQKAGSHLMRALTVYERAKGLTQQLLTFSKGALPVKKNVSIVEVINNAVHFALSGSKVKADVEIDENLPLCNIDRSQIEQVLDNIILNAVQAMPLAGNIRISAKKCGEIPVELKPGGYICISVTDQGIGIPVQHLQRIFDPFFTTKQLGSGLGLATAYSIVKKHDGLITVESVTGKGATFYIYLPVADSNEDKNYNSMVSYKAKGEKVLVMDDEDFIRDIASEILGDIGFICESYEDGEKALNAYSQAFQMGNPYKFAILDLTIPGGIGGLETAIKIRESDKNAIIIASSGYSDDPVMSNPTQFGFTDSLAKPYKREELLSLISKLFNQA
jgi:PAS domain S-box-containing protein